MYGGLCLIFNRNCPEVEIMTIERYLRLMAGTVILVSIALGWILSPNWYLLTAFVGLNLLQSAITNWCPMMTVLKKLGVSECGVPEAR